MAVKKQYIEVTLLSGRSYIGYVMEDFSPNFTDEICFTLYNAHFLYPKTDKKGDPALALISIQNTPGELSPDMDIMWQAVATIQYLQENSKMITEMENIHTGKNGKKEKAEIYVLHGEKENSGKDQK